jgi:hypothetical protein
MPFVGLSSLWQSVRTESRLPSLHAPVPVKKTGFICRPERRPSVGCLFSAWNLSIPRRAGGCQQVLPPTASRCDRARFVLRRSSRSTTPHVFARSSFRPFFPGAFSRLRKGRASFALGAVTDPAERASRTLSPRTALRLLQLPLNNARTRPRAADPRA